mgnify:FL=1
MEKSEQTFKRLKDTATDLPTLPVVLQRLRGAVNDPNSGAQDVARIIQDDPAMVARVLKVVNSAFYGTLEPITSVQAAVARMGMRAIQNTALCTSVFTCFGDEAGHLFDREQFWRHSISTGIAARIIYERAAGRLDARYTTDQLHIAGLLHDVGKIVAEQYLHEDFAAALALSRDAALPLVEAETRVLGTDHAAIGAWLGTQWQLEPGLLAVIGHHHTPTTAQAEPALVAICCVANYICNIEDLGDSGNPKPQMIPHIWKELGLEVSDISDVVDLIHEAEGQSDILMAFV